MSGIEKGWKKEKAQRGEHKKKGERTVGQD
jgi:hypothetical protein